MNKRLMLGTPCGVAAAVAIGLGMAGCNVGPDYKPPQVRVSSTFGELGGPTTLPGSISTTRPSHANSRTIPLAEWWTNFRDPELDSLIQRAVKSNWNLREAESRVRQARGARAQIAPDEYPAINADGGYQHARGSKNVTIPSGLFGGGIPGGATNGGGAPTAGHVIHPNQATAGGPTVAGPQSPLGQGGLPGVDTDLYQVGFDASWEIDVFGGVRRNLQAADADIAAAVEDNRDVLVSLLAEVARDYIDLRGSQRQLQIAQENLRSQRETLALTRDRFNAGLTTQLDVARAAAEVASTAATIPTLVSAIRQSIHALSVLIAEQPEGLAAELIATKPIPPVPPEVPVGLPSDLLQRRPDVRRAERRLAAASARIGVATADLFPKFSITAALGLDSTKPKNLFDYSSRYYDIIPGVSWPIFDAGRIRANISVQNEVEKQAVATYQQAVLTALQEVEDSLVAYQDEQIRRQALADAVEADHQAVDLATDQYRKGVVDFLTVLEAERSLFAAEDQLAQSERSVSGNLVALYKALGGGWEIAPKPPTPG